MRTHTLLYGGAHKTHSMASPQYYDWIDKIAKIKRWKARDMLSDPTYDYEVFYKNILMKLEECFIWMKMPISMILVKL